MKQLLTAAILFTCILLASCWSEEDYTLSPNHQLRFSTDTIAFDTIIAGEPTGTKLLDIYNDARQPLRIKRAQLERGESSWWRINLDGEFWHQGKGTAIEIPPGDSLRLFAEMTAPRTEQDQAQDYEDHLIFTLENGRQQRVLLTAVAQDVVPLKALTVSSSTTLASLRPYQIFDSLVVAAGVTLTLAPGTRLYFHPKSQLIVRGTLRAEGTLERPILMRGDRMGYMFTQQAYDRIPNQWGGVVLTSSSTNNVLEYCDIHSGAFGIRCEPSTSAHPLLQLRNSVLHNTRGHALEATLCRVEATNTQITNAGGDCLHLVGGAHLFVHCTIGQFYPFLGERGVALFYTNEHQQQAAPLHEARFVNTLIVGNSPDDVSALRSTRHKNAAFNYRFQNCLLNTPKPEQEEHIEACIFEQDNPSERRGAHHFSPAFQLERLLFTFDLSPQSPAVNKAALEPAQTLPIDRLGRSRLSDGLPDIGCCEAQPSPTP